LHLLPPLLQVIDEPPAHCALALQVVPVVQAFPSSQVWPTAALWVQVPLMHLSCVQTFVSAVHAVPSATKDVAHWPVEGLHVLDRHSGTAGHVTAATDCLHEPD
jgi:hypothetical protein